MAETNAPQSNENDSDQLDELSTGGKEQPAAGDPVADLQAQLDEANDRVLRTQAELENYRKRARRELEDERRYASISLIRELLAVLDNLERAIEAAEQDAAGSGLLDGVKMVAQQLTTVLGQHNCSRIEAAGAPFDPNLHEALASEPSHEHEPGTVIRETRTGYLLHDRVIRPSQVFVAAAPPETQEEK